MTERKALDDMTSNDLDQLYDQLDRAHRVVMRLLDYDASELADKLTADREGRTVTTGDVREWLKGARCGRQMAASLPGLGPAVGQAGLSGAQGSREGPEAGTEPSEAVSGPQTGTERLHRLRAQLAAAKARMDAADRHSRPDLDHLHGTPQNGISAGLATAIFYLDHHIREAADNRRWNYEKEKP